MNKKELEDAESLLHIAMTLESHQRLLGHILERLAKLEQEVYFGKDISGFAQALHEARVRERDNQKWK